MQIKKTCGPLNEGFNKLFKNILNESSIGDDIDADADSDKDYKLKRAGLKEPRELKESKANILGVEDFEELNDTIHEFFDNISVEASSIDEFLDNIESLISEAESRFGISQTDSGSDGNTYDIGFIIPKKFKFSASEIMDYFGYDIGDKEERSELKYMFEEPARFSKDFTEAVLPQSPEIQVEIEIPKDLKESLKRKSLKETLSDKQQNSPKRYLYELVDYLGWGVPIFTDVAAEGYRLRYNNHTREQAENKLKRIIEAANKLGIKILRPRIDNENRCAVVIPRYDPENSLNESSIGDDIDADADDKKEYAKKVFMKKKDDADSDKDYKLKKAELKESKKSNNPEDLINILADNIQITVKKESDKLTEFEDKASKLLRKYGLRYVDTSRLEGSTYDIRFAHPRKEYVLTVEFDAHTGEITNGGIEEAEYMDEDEWEEIIEILDESFTRDDADSDFDESLKFKKRMKESYKQGVNKMQNKKTRDPLNEGFNKLFKNILNESSIRDDIDADADDKKEYAKKVFMKKKDDADSDKDYKLKKANLKESTKCEDVDVDDYEKEPFFCKRVHLSREVGDLTSEELSILNRKGFIEHTSDKGTFFIEETDNDPRLYRVWKKKATLEEEKLTEAVAKMSMNLKDGDYTMVKDKDILVSDAVMPSAVRTPAVVDVKFTDTGDSARYILTRRDAQANKQFPWQLFLFENVQADDAKKSLTEADKPAALSLEDAQKWVDYDMKHYGKISARTNRLVTKAGFQIIKDDHGDYEVAARDYED